ncbi:MAG TPA: twin-arginine translocation signal domain-containing protein [Chthoniobacterales bacterium]|nr:twin-arginine translocation signal domain-containing protein [Chthoniobacterales bacterium]
MILPDFGKANDRRRFITGTSAALAAIALTSRQGAAQETLESIPNYKAVIVPV